MQNFEWFISDSSFNVPRLLGCRCQFSASPKIVRYNLNFEFEHKESKRSEPKL